MFKNPLIKEIKIHPTLNKNTDFTKFTSGSSHKIWLIDEYNHEWETSYSNFVKKVGCPYCTRKRVLKGVTDLATVSPKIAKELHPTKNGETKADEIFPNSSKKVWWLGECGHEWEATVSNRVNKNSGCPYCTGRKVKANFNDLATTHSKLSKEFHPTKNDILITEISSGSNKKIWWLGECGHEWEDTPVHRTSNNRGCPYCAGQKVFVNQNDLKTIDTFLASEWHPSKNGNILPTNITQGSGYKATWICSVNPKHEWQARIIDRRRGNGCPICNNENFVSKMEKQIGELFNSLSFNVILNTRKIIYPYELDIYIPEKNIAIEFNGIYWHSEDAGKDKNYHFNKWKLCKEKGIQLIQIWEDDWVKNPDLIKRTLLYKLGILESEKIYARNTQVIEISKEVAKNFLNINHIQGYASGSYYLGLTSKLDNNLVAVIVLKKEPRSNGKTLNIIRYATAISVIGGFTKLLKYTEKTYLINKLITFSDHCISDGGLYANNGFVIEKELYPDYMYLVNRERKHKFGYRISRFKNDSTLIFQPNMTEKYLAQLNGLSRIWDAGKTRWVKNL
jgi:predicted Zn-ribbon and HTH transcriptional regulator